MILLGADHCCTASTLKAVNPIVDKSLNNFNLTISTGFSKDSTSAEPKNKISRLLPRYENPGLSLEKDTLRRIAVNPKDTGTTDPFHHLKNKADNFFITRKLYPLIIKDAPPVKEPVAVKSTQYFEPFSGKKIGRVRIQQLDIFGTSLVDTINNAKTWIERTGNRVHFKTTEKKLRRQLLFTEGEAVDPQLMAENEKIIRDLPYINDVSILLSGSKINPGIVDVTILIKERFEYGLNVGYSTSSYEIELINQNVMGLGHSFMADFEHSQGKDPLWGSNFKYEVSDFLTKFVTLGGGYTYNFAIRGWNLYIDKQFVSSSMDWAGGISVTRTFSDHFHSPYGYTELTTPASYLFSDIWYGQLLKAEDNDSKSGNFILAGRYLHRNYYDNTADNSGNSYYRNFDFMLGTFGFSKRYLYKSNKVYGYGITEDIPYGHYAEAAMGLDRNRLDDQIRPYFHLKYSQATILKSGGYFKWQAGIGGYLGNQNMEQGALSLNSTYFSRFIRLNNHPYRFFINIELLSGINRFKEEYLVINRKYGIRDFNSTDIIGTNRLKFNIETVRFWDWSYLGFKFAHYFFADAAFLSDKLKDIFREKFYSGLGFGIRVHNESLVFNVLELRFTWFPVAPGSIKHYNFNGFGQPKSRFDDFLGGKPQEILYE